MTTPNDASSPPPRKPRGLRHALRFHLKLALAVNLAVYMATRIALLRLPDGEAFVLEPRAWRAKALIFLVMGLFDLFYLLIVVATSDVRPSLRAALRLVTFAVLVAPVPYFQSTQAIAAVKSGTSFSFIYPFPFSRDVVPADEVSDVAVSPATFSGIVVFWRKDDRHFGRIESTFVLDSDAAAYERLVRLSNELEDAKRLNRQREIAAAATQPRH